MMLVLKDLQVFPNERTMTLVLLSKGCGASSMSFYKRLVWGGGCSRKKKAAWFTAQDPKHAFDVS